MSESVLQSRYPHDNSLIAEWDVHTDAEVDRILQQVSGAQSQWQQVAVRQRVAALPELARILREESEPFALQITREMGKPIKQARAELDKCAWLCDYYAQSAEGFLADMPVTTAAAKSAVVFKPLGVVLAVMPWNYPWWQALRFAIPAIAAGNGIVLKHASNVSGCAMAIENVMAKVLPENLLRTLLVPSARMQGIIEDDRIAAVTFTGSTSAGSKVGAAAGGALKKAVLELGGSDPYIVLADADIALAARSCASARLVNAGQSCIAAKRFIVVDAVHDLFVAAFKTELEKQQCADPMLETTLLGPMARADLTDELEQQVKATVAQGASIVLGGVRPSSSSAYYPATLLINVTPDMRAAREELFGPVASVIRARDTAHAIDIANDSVFGLGGAIFTADTATGWQLAADELETGAVAINAQLASDPRMPFGGIRQSGYGRELGEFGIREFVNVKSVSLFD